MPYAPSARQGVGSGGRARGAPRRPPATASPAVLRAGPTIRSRTISTTVVGGSITPTPQRCTTGLTATERVPPPRRARRSPRRRRRPSARAAVRRAPASGRHQAASRSSGATARAVTMSPVIGPALVVPAAASSARPRTTRTVRGQPELLHRLEQERGPPGQRLDQRHGQVRPGDRQHEAGQPGTGADVEHGGARRDPLGHRGAVEQVPVPDPRRLPRPDQAAHHTVGGQQLRRTRQPGRAGRRRGRARPRSAPPGATISACADGTFASSAAGSVRR